MSDGKNATPDRAHTSGADGDEVALSRGARRSLGAAPWERFGAYRPARGAVSVIEADRPAAGPGDDGEPTGSHTEGGLTVAELIAKVGGPATPGHSHRRAAPEAEPPEHSDYLDAAYDISMSSAYGSELPDLDAVHRPKRVVDSDRTVVLPKASDRVPPVRIAGTTATEKPAPAPKRKRRPLLVAGRTVAALIAALSLALTGGAYQWSASKNNRLNTISALDPHSRDIVDPNAQYGDENFLIVGVDSRAGENSQMGAGDTEDAGGARSDTVMLVNIPANRKRVVAVSFPRDLAITPIKCEAWNPDTGAYGPLYDEDTKTYGSQYVYTETKLNSAFAFGGPKCLVKVIQKLSGLSINRFIAIDFAGFAKMVDALGGVEVCTTTPLKDYELGTVLDHAGRQVIDGATALNYVRARNVTTENNGDYGRIKRQQRFLSSLLRSLISRDTFFSMNKLNNVVNMFIADSYVDNVKTKDLVDLGQSVQGVSAGRITFVTVPTGETDEDGNEPPRKADMRALFDAIINDEPLPGESDKNPTAGPATKSKPTTPAPSGTHPEQMQAVTTEPEEVTVQVSNSTGTSGLATTASNQLEKNGFNVMTPDDYPTTVSSTTVRFAPGNEQAAATVAAALGKSKVERVTGIGQVVQVILGPDFSAVKTPPPSGSPVNVQIERNSSSTPTKLPEDLTVTNAADTTCE
ncbi:LCP family protein [Mycobacterium shimoidei]|uniref:LCP family protein n=1 Tax=Mycobacterium shimoidei TaxID=29313 RepID=UPI0008493FEF|nr:LCP family protein [Mycobacterium shimoidei]MCV7260982.1 LCP family protein [Mycobacterium shimoidei]ODR13575.1 transcriptional regulator [Mycobacterium shimoidei]ORW76512.1 transcriptional regulator [Mycobacterium shimoidei]